VSTDEQTKKYGLSSQVTELRALAARKGFAIPEGAEYLDDGYSGTDLDRPALNRLREAVRAGAFQVLLILDPDRLSRRLSHQLVLVEEFERAGVQLEFLSVPKEDTPEGRLLVHVKGVIAEYEREKIRERTMRGKKEKARRGLIPAGPTPYGYRQDPATPGKLVVHDDEASVIRMIFGWLADEVRSIRDITTELQRLGIRPRRGVSWSKSSVRRVLTSEMYVGRAYFNRRTRTGQGMRMRFRPEAEWFSIAVPAIVPQALFDQAQAQLARNLSRLVGRPPAHFYLLRGLLRCGACGRKYVGTPMHGHRFYRCAGRDRLIRGTPCRAGMLSADALERFIWETVVDTLRRPEVLTQKVEAHRAKVGTRTVEIRSQVDHLERELAKVERQEARLLDAYVDEQLQVPALKARLADVAGRKAGLAAQVARAQAKIASDAAEAAHKESVVHFCRLALRGLDKLAPEGRQRLLQALIDEVVLRDDAVELHGVLPGRWIPPSRTSEPRARNRAKSQQIVAACGGNLEGALGPEMTPHICEIEGIRIQVSIPAGGPGPVRGDLALAVQVLEGVVERTERDHGDAPDHCGLLGISRGDEETPHSAAPTMQRDGEHATNGLDPSVERELAQGHRIVNPSRLEYAGGGENAQRHGQIEGRAHLADLGGRQIDGDPVHGEFEPRVADRRPHAITALAHRGVGEAHRRERRQARRHVDLYEDVVGLDAEHGGRSHARQHDPSLGTCGCPVNGSIRIHQGLEGRTTHFARDRVALLDSRPIFHRWTRPDGHRSDLGPGMGLQITKAPWLAMVCRLRDARCGVDGGLTSQWRSAASATLG